MCFDLGEWHLEEGRWDEAVNEFESCIEKRSKHLEPDDRILAESYFQLGLAHDHNNNFNGAITSYKEAVRIIRAAVGRLR